MPPVVPLALLRRLEWRLRGAVETTLGGEYRSAFRGRGMEFDQVVKYEFGDDVRDIDWNVTARLGEPYRKKFVEEREVSVLVLFEDTPSLQFGSAAQSKREALLELAGLIMLLGAVNRDRVGVIYSAPDHCEILPPVRGRGAIHHAAAKLFGMTPPPVSGGSQTEIPWKKFRYLAPHRSVIVWLGDFAPRPAPDGWQVIQSRFQTLGFRVDDPWERHLPDAEISAFDPVHERLVTLENSIDERAAHKRWRDARDANFHNLFPDAGSRLAVQTTENRLDALVRFFGKQS